MYLSVLATFWNPFVKLIHHPGQSFQVRFSLSHSTVLFDLFNETKRWQRWHAEIKRTILPRHTATNEGIKVNCLRWKVSASLFLVLQVALATNWLISRFFYCWISSLEPCDNNAVLTVTHSVLMTNDSRKKVQPKTGTDIPPLRYFIRDSTVVSE